jgi:hypothetical protein
MACLEVGGLCQASVPEEVLLASTAACMVAGQLMQAGVSRGLRVTSAVRIIDECASNESYDSY